MRHAVLALLLAISTSVAASQLVGLKDGRADCTGFDPDKLSVVQSGQDWRVTVDGSNGYTVALVASKEDAEAARGVIQKNQYTVSCRIGQGDRSFRYFESARR
jgi:hypothetical protein